MDWIQYDQSELTRLRREGFTERQIMRWYHLRRRYARDEMDRPALDSRRLEFARWLVTTGRLSEQIDEVPPGDHPRSKGGEVYGNPATS
jgi:hypothetical protein